MTQCVLLSLASFRRHLRAVKGHFPCLRRKLAFKRRCQSKWRQAVLAGVLPTRITSPVLDESELMGARAIGAARHHDRCIQTRVPGAAEAGRFIIRPQGYFCLFSAQWADILLSIFHDMSLESPRQIDFTALNATMWLFAKLMCIHADS